MYSIRCYYVREYSMHPSLDEVSVNPNFNHLSRKEEKKEEEADQGYRQRDSMTD